MISKIVAVIYIVIFLASSTVIAITLIYGEKGLVGIFMSTKTFVIMNMIACLAIVSIIATIPFFFRHKNSLLGILGERKERIAQGIHLVLFLWSIPVAVIWCFLPCWPWFGKLKKLQQLMNSGNPVYLIILIVAMLIFVLSLIIDWIIVSMVVGFILRAFMSKQEARVYFQKIQDQRPGLIVMDWIVMKIARFYFWLLERIWR